MREDPHAVLLDIRTPEEVEGGQLPNSLTIDFRHQISLRK
ncbi:MAG: rhodanese-related sulfurtransferase [Arenicella sp.]|jgi:rhodanese-related sulfurtransferase